MKNPLRDPSRPIDMRRVREWFDVGGIEIPREEETKHLLMLGDIGSGKSSLFRWYLYQIRLRDEPAIVVDLDREFIETFYVPGKDKILNPTDRRMPRWTPGREVNTVGEAEALASSFLPGEPNGLNSFFTLTARGAFVDFLAVFDRDDPAAIAKACTMPLRELHASLQGRPSSSSLTPEAAPTAENVRATLQAATRGLSLLPNGNPDRDAWTLKKWVENPKGWLFLTSTPDDWEVTKPLITAWLDILARKLLARPVGAEPLVHVVVDEMAALGRSEQLLSIFTRARKRGVAAKVATQSSSQIEKLYGQDAKTLMSQAKSKIIYRCSEPDLAKWASGQIGSVERHVSRVNLRAGMSAKGHEAVTLNEDTKTVPLVLPIQISQLPDFEGYYIFGGETTYIKPPYTRQLKIQKPYIPRRGSSSDDLFSPARVMRQAPRLHNDPTPGGREVSDAPNEFGLDIRSDGASDKGTSYSH